MYISRDRIYINPRRRRQLAIASARCNIKVSSNGHATRRKHRKNTPYENMQLQFISFRGGDRQHDHEWTMTWEAKGIGGLGEKNIALKCKAF